MCDCYDIDMSGQYFAVMLIYIEDFSNFSLAAKDGETLSLINFIFRNVIEELMKGKNKMYITEVDDLLVCLININEENINNSKNEMIKIVEEAKHFIENKMGIYFTLSLSDVHNSLTEIPNAYQEALECIEYKMLIGRGQIIEFDRVKKLKTNNYEHHYSIEEQQWFVNAIKAGDYKNAKKVLNEIFNKSFSKDSISIEIVKCRMFGLIDTMLNVMEEISIICDNEFIQELNFLNRLFTCETVNELKEQMNDILNRVDEYINNKKKQDDTELKESIEGYIHENYSDINLSVSMISDKFNKDPSYLTRIFKKHTGSALLEYIHKYRIQKAKQLLRKNDSSIKKIAEEVGYYNSNAFIRVFKKYEGITPGKYKEIDVS